MSIEVNKLDNPAWFSLSEVHSNFKVEYDGVKFYKPNYCPFGGFIEANKTLAGLDQYSRFANSFYVIGDKPYFSDNLKMNHALVCNQMILNQPIKLEIEASIIQLNKDHKTDLFNLVNLVQPGYFRKSTSELGNYYGIFENNQLVAVTGERMKMNHYTEVSAIVTHPKYTGKGYAKQLIAFTTNKVFSENKIPYLHVSENNIGAINLYEKLGFLTRRKICFWNLIALPAKDQTHK